MERIDEKSRRLPGFRTGTPVEGADGQVWQVPRPVVVFDADDTEAGFTTRLTLGGDDRLSELSRERVAVVEAVSAAPEADQDWTRLVVVDLKVRAYLLTANYRLSTAEMNAVFPFVYDTDHPLRRIVDEILDVARGLGPKRRGGGDESPPTPPG